MSQAESIKFSKKHLLGAEYGKYQGKYVLQAESIKFSKKHLLGVIISIKHFPSLEGRGLRGGCIRFIHPHLASPMEGEVEMRLPREINFCSQ